MVLKFGSDFQISDSVVQRGEKLELLVEKAEDLNSSVSFIFNKMTIFEDGKSEKDIRRKISISRCVVKGFVQG